MSSVFKASRVTVSSSITNDTAQTKLDKVKPFTFIEFLNYAKTLDKNIVDFSDYQQYLRDWNEKTTNRFDDLEEQVRNEFTACLKSIVVDFTTSEEKKLIANIDFNNVDDIETTVPFFTRKIKEIILYFAEKRNTYVYDLQLAKNRGSVAGIADFVKSSINDILFSNQSLLSQPLSSIDPHIEIEEGYDRFNDYFDIDDGNASSIYFAEGTRYSFFSSNVNTVDPDIEIDLDNAIVTQINKYGVRLKEISNLLINVDTPDLDLLTNSEFVDYNTRIRSNLRVLLELELAKKLLATDFYYLSTNSNGESLSGKLFEASLPYNNLLNIHNPTVLAVPQPSTEYERDVGLFFKPTYKSILRLQTPFTHTISKNLPPDTVFIYPNPRDYGNVVGVSKTTYKSPLTFSQKGLDIQKNISSNNSIGSTLVSDRDFTFDSYLSQEQISDRDTFKQFVNAGVLVSKTSDLFGNTFICLKHQNTDYINQLSTSVEVNSATSYLSSYNDNFFRASVKSLTGTGTFNGTNTVISPPQLHPNRPTIWNSKAAIGKFYVHNLQSTEDSFVSLSSQFTDVFSKYANKSYDLNNALIDLRVYNNTYVFTTTANVIVDQVLYNGSTFKKSPNVPLITDNVVNRKTSNEFIIKDNLFLITSEIDQLNALSASNVRTYLFKLYAYDIKTGNITQYQFVSNDRMFFETKAQSHIEGLILTYNSKYDQFILTTNLKDTNRNLYIHSMYFTLSNGKVKVTDNKIFVPNIVSLTYNFTSFENLTNMQVNYIEPVLYTGPINWPEILQHQDGKLLF